MKLTLAQLKEAHDLDLGTSAWLRIDQDRIDRFAAATDDHQWIHVDRERAARGPFAGTIAHGYLVLSLVPTLLFEMVTFPDAGLTVNYGLDKLRFLSPVPQGGEICLNARLVSASAKASGVLFRVRAEVRRRDDGKRALVAELLFLAQPAAADG